MSIIKILRKIKHFSDGERNQSVSQLEMTVLEHSLGRFSIHKCTYAYFGVTKVYILFTQSGVHEP